MKPLFLTLGFGAASILAACQPAPEAKPDDPRIAYYEEISPLVCQIVYGHNDLSTGGETRKADVYGYEDIGDGWTRIDVSIQSTRLNIYLNPSPDGGVYCGDANWRNYGPKRVEKTPDGYPIPTDSQCRYYHGLGNYEKERSPHLASCENRKS